MSIYSLKTASQGVQPWATALTLFPGSQKVDPFFGLYSSLGDMTLTGANTITTLLDGPEKVVRYGNLVLGDGTTATSLTASLRNKGLTLLCDTLTVKNNATLNMTGRGARVTSNDNPFFPFVDFKIPTQITLSSNTVSLQSALGVIKAQGYAPWDLGTWQSLVSPLSGFNLAISQDGSLVLLSAAGCGDGGPGGYNQAAPFVSGGAGSSGGMGGGGGGGSATAAVNCRGGKGGKASPYSGGSGGGGCFYTGNNSSGGESPSYSGPGGRGGAFMATITTGPESALDGTSGGGGAGNPGGLGCLNGPSTAGSAGTGGKLVVIARTSITVLSGGKIESNGTAGGNGNYAPGGGSGGGHISIITPVGGYSNAGTVQATGGASGTGSGTGGAGGAGSVVVKTFTEMGW